MLSCVPWVKAGGSKGLPSGQVQVPLVPSVCGVTGEPARFFVCALVPLTCPLLTLLFWLPLPKSVTLNPDYEFTPPSELLNNTHAEAAGTGVFSAAGWCSCAVRAETAAHQVRQVTTDSRTCSHPRKGLPDQHTPLLGLWVNQQLSGLEKSKMKLIFKCALLRVDMFSTKNKNQSICSD